MEHTQKLEKLKQALIPEDTIEDNRKTARSFVSQELYINKMMKKTNSAESYFSIPYYSASALQRYEKNPSLINWNRQQDNQFFDAEWDSTKDMMLGSIIHKAVLEPEDWQQSRDTYKSMLNNTDRNIIDNMISGLVSNKFCMNILKDYKLREQVITFDVDFPERNKKVKCKSKIDCFTKQGFLVELKTMPELEQLPKKMDDFRYDLQLSFYKQALVASGEKVSGVLVIAIEKKKPFQSHVFDIGKSYLTRGELGGTIRGKDVRGWRDILEEMHFFKRSRFRDKFTFLEV